MCEEPWNKLALRAPSAQSSVLLPRDPHLLGLCATLSDTASKARVTLHGQRLRVDCGVLRAVLRVFHSRMRTHKPYIAVRQVEKCFIRLSGMKLELHLQELHNSCASLPKSLTGDSVYVPSRPFLEWTALLVMGASKLLLRTVAMCERAFLLVLHHLHLEEYITLNLLLAAVLSRLWVLCKPALQALVGLYGELRAMLRAVSSLHGVSMARGFVFPDALEEWLGPDFSHVLEIGAPFRAHKAQISSDLLELLFASGEISGKSAAELVEISAAAAAAVTPTATTTAQRRPQSQNVTDPDIGTRLERERSLDSMERKFDWLTQSRQSTPCGSERQVKRESGTLRKTSRMGPTMPVAPQLVNSACQAATFAEMAAVLGALARAFRHQRQRRPMLHLGSLRLKCTRLAMLERLGYELHTKFRHMKATVRRFLRSGVGALSPLASRERRAKLRDSLRASCDCLPSAATDTANDSESSPAVAQPLGHSMDDATPGPDDATPGPHDVSSCPPSGHHVGPKGHAVLPGYTEPNTEVTHDFDIDDIFSALGC